MAKRLVVIIEQADFALDQARRSLNVLGNEEDERLNQLGHKLIVEAATVENLVREGFHRTLGARPMRNAVEGYLQNITVGATLRHEA